MTLMRPRYSILPLAFLFEFAASNSLGADSIYRCPGPPVQYVDDISEQEAKDRGCGRIQDAPRTEHRNPANGPIPSAVSAPSCTIKSVPAVMCTHPKTAALMARQIGSRWEMVNDSNNRQLLVENGCTLIRQRQYIGKSVEPVLKRTKVATQLGWTEVQLVDIPGALVPSMYIAASYLAGPCPPVLRAPNEKSLPRGIDD